VNICHLNSESLPEPSPAPEVRRRYERDTVNEYNMSHKRRGRFVVINNKCFSEKLCGQGMGERRGTDVDAASLIYIFRRLGFDVECKSDLTAAEMLKCVTLGLFKGYLCHIILLSMILCYSLCIIIFSLLQNYFMINNVAGPILFLYLRDHYCLIHVPKVPIKLT